MGPSESEASAQTAEYISEGGQTRRPKAQHGFQRGRFQGKSNFHDARACWRKWKLIQPQDQRGEGYKYGEHSRGDHISGK